MPIVLAPCFDLFVFFFFDTNIAIRYHTRALACYIPGIKGELKTKILEGTLFFYIT